MTRFLTLIWFVYASISLNAQVDGNQFHHILYINSYGITYSWGDSVAKGIMQTLAERKDVILYVEYLDSKRFGNKNHELNYQLFKSKYLHSPIEAVLLSDNDALDFF